MADIRIDRAGATIAPSDAHLTRLASVLHHAAVPLPPPERAEDFGAVFDDFANARIVLLGEATHGSSEFYKARAAITRRLVQEHGFTIVAAEADWPDAARVDRYIRHLSHEPGQGVAFARFPTWMWRNEEVLDFVEWLRSYNVSQHPEARAEFRGLDVYSLGASIEAVLNYLDRVDPEGAKVARRRYACLSPWQDDPARYGQAIHYGQRDSCEDAVVEQLTEMLGHRLDYVRQDGGAYLDAAQNARIVRAAEQYYRIMYRGATESWNLRDRHMFDTLQMLMSARPDAKAVVWAHNSHIGNAAATAMGWQGEFNIGELCRTAYGNDAILIGFGTDRGTVAAADDWGGPMRIKTVRPARSDSYEHVFRHAGYARSLTDWRRPERRDLVETLSEPRLERAIGVVYRPESELLSHYFRAVLAEQFDAYVWFEETKAVTPLAPAQVHAMAETYPFGV